MTKPYLKRSKYAAHIGRSPGYITQLAAQGRVVFTPDGRFVDVAKTNALIAATADPAKQPVADRHAAQRAAKTQATTQAPAPAIPAPTPDPTPADAAEDDAGSPYNFQGSKAKREYYAAERERAAFLKEAGELMERGQVVAAFADAGAAFRAAVESWAADLPPLLVGQPEDAIRLTLTAEVERLLADLAARIHKLAQPTA